MTQWNAHYRDETHDLDIVITNEEADKFDNLSFTIDGVTFIGGDISSFELKDPTQYELAQARFRLLKWGGKFPGIDHFSPYTYSLQRYSMTIDIPVWADRTCDGSLTRGVLHVGYRYVPHDMERIQSRFYCDDQRVWVDDLEVTCFRFTVDGNEYPILCDSLWFDENLSDLCSALPPDYRLRCCYTCQWSDYSPYGSDDFGTMLCYKAHQEEYLNVNSKNGYFEFLEPLTPEQRQETYLCPDFAPRDQCRGYRGYVTE